MSAPALKLYVAWGSTWKTGDSSSDLLLLETGGTDNLLLETGDALLLDDATLAWTDETAYVLKMRGVNTRRGRSSELDDFQAGTFSLVLDNRTRRFDPQHASGALFGNLKPGVPVKLEGVPSGLAARGVIRGFINGFPQDYDLSNKLAVVNVSCTDGFAKLATAGMPSSVFAYEVDADNPKAWFRLGESAGDVLADASGNGHHGRLTPGTSATSTRHPNQWESTTALELDLDHYASVDKIGAAVSARPCTLEVIVRPVALFTGAHIQMGNGLGGLHLNVQMETGLWYAYGTVHDGSSGGYGEGATHAHTAEGVHAAVRFPASGNAQIYVNGVVDTVQNLTSGSAIRYSGISITTDDVDAVVVADVVVWDSDIGATRVGVHGVAASAPWNGDLTGARLGRLLDVAGWPSGLRTIATGLTTMGPATLGQNCLPLAKGVEAAEQGRLFISRDGKVIFRDRYYHQTVTEGSTSQATFSDDGSDIPYSGLGFDYDDRLVLNKIRGNRVGGAPIDVIDQTSIDTYGEQVDSKLTNLQVTSDSVVRSLAEYRLSRYKDPAQRTRPIEIKLHGLTAAQQATVLDLELGYRVTVERTPQGVGSQFAQATIVEGISHRITGDEWTMTLQLSPVDTAVHALWGTGLWGTALWGA